MESGYKIFTLKGYEKATVDEIVDDAGYSKDAFYFHFKAKEDLFLAIMDTRVEKQQLIVSQSLDLQASLYDNLFRIMSLLIELVKKDNWVPIYMEFLAQSSRNEKVRARMATMYSNWRNFLKDLILKLQDTKLISRNIDPVIAASIILMIFDGYNMQTLVEPNVISLDNIIEELAVILS